MFCEEKNILKIKFSILFLIICNFLWRFIYVIDTLSLQNYLRFVFLDFHIWNMIKTDIFTFHQHFISIDSDLWHIFTWADCPVSSSMVCLILTIRVRERGSPWFFRLVKICIFTWSWEICDYKANFAPPYLKGFSLRVLTCVTCFCLKICRGQRSQWAMNVRISE